MIDMPVASNSNERGRVLLSCTADLYVNTIIASRGMLVISDSYVAFTPGNLELLNKKNLVIGVKIDQIKSAKVIGLRRRLCIETHENKKLIFGGSSVRRAFMILIAILEDMDGDMDSQDLMMPTWDAHFYQGPLASPGEISVNARNFRFVPSSALEALVKTVDILKIPMAEIVESRVKGRLDKRLIISTRTNEFSFSVGDLEQKCAEFSFQLVHTEGTDEPQAGLDGLVSDVDWASDLLSHWDLNADKEEILLFGAVVYVSKNNVIRRGWLILTDSSGFFIPAHKVSGGPQSLVIPCLRISRTKSQSADPGELLLNMAGSEMRFLCRGGDAFVDEFWRQWNRIPEVRAKKDADNKPSLSLQPGENINRRENFRVSVSQVADFEVAMSVILEVPKGRTKKISVEPIDLAVGGLSVYTSEKVYERSEVNLSIRLEDQFVKCLGLIVYCKKIGNEGRYRVGISLPVLLIFDEKNLRDIVMKCQQYRLSSRPSN